MSAVFTYSLIAVTWTLKHAALITCFCVVLRNDGEWRDSFPQGQCRSGETRPTSRCCLDFHLDLKLWKSCSVGDRLQKIWGDRKGTCQNSGPYLCPYGDGSSGRLAAWFSLLLYAEPEFGHGWYQWWMWSDILVHSTHQSVAFRMSLLATDRKWRHKCSERLLPETQMGSGHRMFVQSVQLRTEISVLTASARLNATECRIINHIQNLWHYPWNLHVINQDSFYPRFVHCFLHHL